jgi:hypothetical protein
VFTPRVAVIVTATILLAWGGGREVADWCAILHAESLARRAEANAAAIAQGSNNPGLRAGFRRVARGMRAEVAEAKASTWEDRPVNYVMIVLGGWGLFFGLKPESRLVRSLESDTAASGGRR